VATPPSDLDLMMLADGELPPDRAREVQAAVDREPALKAKLVALGQVGETVRGYLETETDRAEADLPEFADMWATIERRIAASGSSAEAAPAAPAPARSSEPGGAWAAIRGWFEGHRGHLMSGLVGAGAVAGLMVWLGPPARIIERTTVQAPTMGPTQVAAPAPCGPATLAPAMPPEVESFEVYEGSGMVFTLPGEGEGDSAATVIWISKDQDTVEGPI
jgi:anti-sigma factor RsiW